jgi:Domain of unknown function (DUF4403)
MTRYFFLLSFLFLASCQQTTQLATTAPTPETTIVPQLERQLSTLSVPITVPVQALTDRLNRELKGQLYRDDNLEGDNVAVTVTKAAPLTLLGADDRISLRLPLRIKAKGRWLWEPCKFCPKVDKEEETEFDLVAKTVSRVKLGEDYRFLSTSEVDFEWGEHRPEIKLGPITIGLARFVEPVLRRQLADIGARLDRELADRVSLKAPLLRAWTQVQQPVLLDARTQTWLVISPQALRVSPLRAQDGQLFLRVGVTSFLETVIGPKPKVIVNRALPALVTDGRLSDEAQITVAGEVPFAEASRLARTELVGRTFTFNKEDQLTINDVNIAGAGQKLVLMLDVNGQTHAGFFTKKLLGKVYLKATPYYDAATQTIRLRDADFTLDTRDRLLKAADWLLHGNLRQRLEQQVSFPVKGQLEQARGLIQGFLDKPVPGALPPGLRLGGKLTTFEPGALYLTEKSIRATLIAKGAVQLTVEEL